MLMKKLVFILSVCAIMVFSSVTVFATGGDGTEETPFLITNQEELELVTDFPDCHFRLVNDIELVGTWIPLCKATSSGVFTGSFDGAGHTISNLSTNCSQGGLFNNNEGKIRNLNIIISSDGMTGSGAVAHNNDGTISGCVVTGNIYGDCEYMGGICSENTSVVSDCEYKGTVKNTSNTGSTGGICGYNTSYLMSCKFEGRVENTDTKGYINASGNNGGICGYNSSETSYSAIIALCTSICDINVEGGYAGGICGNNSDDIKSSYFMGSIGGYSGYTGGGICGYNSFSNARNDYASVISCYSVASGVQYGIGSGEANYTSDYYDKTVSGLTSTNRGTPKSTAAMKMKQTYDSNWDFDTIWGIDENINGGYPYLLREYPDVEEKTPYTVNSIKLTDLSGNELEQIPNSSFCVEVSITKNDNSKDADSIIIAMYDDNGTFVDIRYMKGVYYQNQTIDFGVMINKTEKTIADIRCFVWNSISGLIPLSNASGIAN